MKDYQIYLHPLALFLRLMHVVITIDFNELDLSYADSNDFISKSLRPYVEEIFLAVNTFKRIAKNPHLK